MRPILAATALAGLTAFSGCRYARVGPAVPAAPVVSDPPARVARISYQNGSVSIRPGGADEWVSAIHNRPLTSGDSIWTAAGARAEVHFGSAAVRLDAQTRVELLNVGTDVIQLKLTGGTVSARLRQLDENEVFEIATPDAAISLVREGEYRVEVPESGPPTLIAVRSGMADVTGAGSPLIVRAGQQIRVPGGTAKAIFAQDSFDRFCAEREAREEKALASRQVPPRMIGYEDLDEYGDWRTSANYGPVWYPRSVPPGWAPYRFGHWVWIEPWGWTWVDDAPWGFAPFHYGRWVYIDGHWVWVPGPFHRYPIYAPALVVFAGGGGPGFRFYFQVGLGPGIAWFPLGPREVWLPPYRASRTYVTNINIRNTVIVDPGNIHRVSMERQRYVNRAVSGAMTAIPEDAFRRAEPANRHAVRLDVRDQQSARIGGSAPPAAPIRESLGRREGNVATPPAPRRDHVIVNRPPPASPVPFERRRPALDSAAGRAPEPQRVEDLRRGQPEKQPSYRVERGAERPRSPESRPPAASRQETERDRQWDQRTTRETEQRSRRVEGERQRTQPRTRESQPQGSGGRQRK